MAGRIGASGIKRYEPMEEQPVIKSIKLAAAVLGVAGVMTAVAVGGAGIASASQSPAAVSSSASAQPGDIIWP